MGAALSSLLLNVFFWVVVIEFRTRGATGAVPHLAGWAFGLSRYAFLTLGGGGIALLLFAMPDLKDGDYATTVLTLVLYCVYVAWVWPADPSPSPGITNASPGGIVVAARADSRRATSLYSRWERPPSVWGGSSRGRVRLEHRAVQLMEDHRSTAAETATENEHPAFSCTTSRIA